ncbi:MAG: PLP-dependent aminotransferase family protein [Elusimicrobiaceae bacterium]|nr:PLP-dependent aminotransferase family protein [Elusimicrobiaceae bacterium]
MIDLVKNLASVNRRTKGSVIRELLKLTNKPEIISFAGGLPDPDAFPTKEIAEVTQHVLATNAKNALQYGPTEGVAELKTEIIKMLKEDEGIDAVPEEILITSASQQALDIIGKAFIDLSDPIIVGVPTYLAGLQVFKGNGAEMIGLRSDGEGILPEDLEERLKKLRYEEEHYKFLYLVPDFQNPTGTTLSQERRRKIIELSAKYDLVIIEDSPYRQIRFEGKAPDMLYKLDTTGNVISLFTFSKTMAPGLRVGFILAQPELIRRFALLKQSIDLCTSPFTQLVIAEFMKRGYLRPHTDSVVANYRAKRNLMIKVLKETMPAGVTWTEPQGGLFLWLSLPPHMDAVAMFPKAIEKNVAYVIGEAFHCDGSGRNTMRINFSYATHEQIVEGITRLSNVIKENI